MKKAALVALAILVLVLWMPRGTPLAQDGDTDVFAGAPPPGIAASVGGSEGATGRQLRRSFLTRRLQQTSSPVQLAQSCPPGYSVDCGDFCCSTGYSCETECKCLEGYAYCGFFGEFCCQPGYSCATGCQCRQGQGACSSGCCPLDKPHTCAEISECFETAQGAIDAGCTWESVEVCGLIQ